MRLSFRHVGAWAAAIVVLLGVIALPASSMGQAAEESGIDLTGPASPEVCMACHSQMGETDVPGLMFSHGNHLLVRCVACHTRPAHEAGYTYRPTMRTCFTCHGVFHGAQGELATSACEDCHTPQWQLRPSSHVEDWAETPHAKASKLTGVNECMMCHYGPSDCDGCHAEQSVDVEAMPETYVRFIPEEPARPSVVIDTKATPAMGNCTFCHKTIDKTADPELIFAHAAHLRRDYDCAVCHDVFPHRPQGTATPTMVSCYRCHSLKHAAQGDAAPEECELCHPPAFELKPPDHTVAFAIGGHKEDAQERMTECTMCHKSSFCAPCHKGGFKMANGAASPSVIPADHRQPEWQPDHGRQYLSQRGACSTCHVSEDCISCHQTAMPHPSEWLARHGAGNGYPKEDCRVCHKDRTGCQDCHHAGVGGNELIAENCVGCHEEMKTEPATAIKNAPLAEHAVHFNVAEKKGRPYVCDDCHIGFTIARVNQPGVSTQAHDLRLCYDCHGSLDVSGLLIAPWPGKELCRQCHYDMRF